MSKKMTKAGMKKAANLLGVDVASIKAVIEVESRGNGFYNDGRPLILYEPHVAHLHTSGAVRAKLAKSGLAYARWGQRKYPSGYAARYDQLYKAIKIAGDKAYEFASYGLPQMMGFNYKVCGHNSAKSMFDAMCRSEDEQLMVMAYFIKSNSKMLKALKARDWAGFARRYNGPGYKKNNYHVKLAKAYKRHSGGIFTSKKAQPSNKSWIGLGDKGAAVKELQQKMVKLGANITADGDFGALSKQALQTIQRKLKLKADGIAGRNTMTAINNAI